MKNLEKSICDMEKYAEINYSYSEINFFLIINQRRCNFSGSKLYIDFCDLYIKQ